MDIATNIKVLRERSGLSQGEFAKLLGVSDKAVSTWENGRREPRIGVIRKLSSAFNLSISDITDSDLEAYYKNKDSPAPAEAEAREKNQVTREDLLEVLQKLHIVESSSDALSDADLQFLMHIITLIDDWFSNHG